MAKKKTEQEKNLEFIMGVFILVSIYLIGKKLYVWFGFFLALFVFIIVLMIKRKKRFKEKFFESKNSLDKIRLLTPNQFEDFVCYVFEKLGFETERVGGSFDGGIDVIARKDGIEHYIQCKKFITSQVSVGAVRDFYGAIMHKKSHEKAFFITTNIFTIEAEKFLQDKPIEMIDGKRFMEYVKMAGVDVDSVIEKTGERDDAFLCPQCNSPLVQRTACRGQYSGKIFLGCVNYPKCRYMKNDL